MNNPFSIGGNVDAPGGEFFGDEASREQDPVQRQWQHRDYNKEDSSKSDDNVGEAGPPYGSFHEERNAWGRREDDTQ